MAYQRRLPTVGSAGGLEQLAGQYSSNALQGMSAMRPDTTTTTAPPDKTAGGAIGSAAGMAAAGFMVGGPWGAAAGAVVGLASYFLS